MTKTRRSKAEQSRARAGAKVNESRKASLSEVVSDLWGGKETLLRNQCTASF